MGVGTSQGYILLEGTFLQRCHPDGVTEVPSLRGNKDVTPLGFVGEFWWSELGLMEIAALLVW